MPFGRMPTALVIAPSKGIKTLQELVAAAKAKPGALTYASAGVGSTTHLTAERFRLSAGFTAVHVPFRGGGFRPEVIAGPGRFRASRRSRSRCRDIRDGRLLALAVSGTSAPRRLPDVPTTLEAGYAEFRLCDLARRVLAGEDAARDRRAAAHETMKALERRALRERLNGLDVEPMPMTPARIRRVHQARDRRQGALAKAAGLKPN